MRDGGAEPACFAVGLTGKDHSFARASLSLRSNEPCSGLSVVLGCAGQANCSARCRLVPACEARGPNRAQLNATVKQQRASTVTRGEERGKTRNDTLVDLELSCIKNRRTTY